MNELDEILLEQWHNARKSKKVIKRVRKLLKNDPVVDKGEEYIDKRLQFLESMISDKSLLYKRHKRRKQKDLDVLARSPVYEMYRNTLYFTVFGYKMLTDSLTNYMSYFKKGKG